MTNTYKATVKWYEDAKGYGFVAIDGKPDAFIHYTALYGEGFKTLREGQEITVELLDGPKGPQVAKCTDWNKII